MIAEYGSPTLFLRLSCAEYDSANRGQYLRKRGVLGNVEQYYVKKEYQSVKRLIITSSYGLKMLLLSVVIIQMKSIVSYKIELPVLYRITSTR
uniref:Uncharacterized protein n=1 Tax=Amphimedon queenslandica TaxID=400682 RepID=A0A1X7UYJ2_AMPQE